MLAIIVGIILNRMKSVRYYKYAVTENEKRLHRSPLLISIKRTITKIA